MLSVLSAFLLLLISIAVFRLYYSRTFILLAFLVTLVWQLLRYRFWSREADLKLAVVPGGAAGLLEPRQEALSEIASMGRDAEESQAQAPAIKRENRWIFLREPKLPQQSNAGGWHCGGYACGGRQAVDSLFGGCFGDGLAGLSCGLCL